MADQEAREILTDAERAVLAALNEGRLVSGSALAVAAGCAGTQDVTRRRRLRELIWHLRSAHRIPILSSSRGYWLARSPDEIAPFARRMQQVGRDHLAIASIVQQVTVDVAAGQMLLDLFAHETETGGRPRRRDSAYAHGWRLHLEAGRRRIQIADVLGRTLELLRRDPELFAVNKHVLAEEYGVMVLTANEARNLRLAKQLIAGIGERN